jgi:hypothetical protein
MSHNACIVLLSSRQGSINKCLWSIHDHFNHWDYPIYVHYFDDIYDGKEISLPNVEFIQVPYRTPIKEEELFYNRNNNYAKRFGIGRKGYLHMCNFICNMYRYPNTKIHNHDYVIVFDDDSGFVKDVDFDPINKLKGDMGAMITGFRLKDGKPPPNHIDTREGLWGFVKDYIYKNEKYPECDLLRDVLKGPNAEYIFHYLPWSDGYVIKTVMYETVAWKKWIHAVNRNGGIYKHRWGDNELMSLFYMIYYPEPIQNLGIVERGYLDQGLFRRGVAPGVKNNDR